MVSSTKIKYQNKRLVASPRLLKKPKCKANEVPICVEHHQRRTRTGHVILIGNQTLAIQKTISAYQNLRKTDKMNYN